MAVDRLARLGGEPVAVDFGSFLQVARLLFESGLIAERYHGILEFLKAGKVCPATSMIELLIVLKSVWGLAQTHQTGLCSYMNCHDMPASAYQLKLK